MIGGSAWSPERVIELTPEHLRMKKNSAISAANETERAVTVGDLFHSVDRDAVIAAIEQLYEDEAQRESNEGYQRAWATVLRMQPSPTKMICVLYQDWSLDQPPKPFVGVRGRIDGEAGSYAIEYTPWTEWLSMPVEIEPIIAGMPQTETVAHILWEMTWAGCDETNIQEQFNEIVDLAEEAKAELAKNVQ
jgi:hypothetical protein